MSLSKNARATNCSARYQRCPDIFFVATAATLGLMVLYVCKLFNKFKSFLGADVGKDAVNHAFK